MLLSLHTRRWAVAAGVVVVCAAGARPSAHRLRVVAVSAVITLAAVTMAVARRPW